MYLSGSEWSSSDKNLIHFIDTLGKYLIYNGNILFYVLQTGGNIDDDDVAPLAKL